MNEKIRIFFGSVFPLTLGLVMLFCRKVAAKMAIEFRRRYFGVEVNETMAQLFFTVVAIIFIVFGFLHLFGIVHLRE